ncbi:MAG TPA: DUF3368 domain-containing protein [Nodosilinea sp.]|nr:DUF3368 domain-containing protein [Nodosilinea sp.]
MPEVIADTSVMQYLFQSNHFLLLPNLYENLVIPKAVKNELDEGRKLGILLPQPSDYEWIQPVAVEEQRLVPQIPGLGQGEREVLSLSMKQQNALALLDDGLARQYARRLNIRVTGTLGILLKAKQSGLIDQIGPVIDSLKQLGFRVSEETQAAILSLAAEATW